MAANTIITSIVTGGSASHATVAEEANAIATDFVSQGVTGPITPNAGSGGTGSFCVNQDASPDMGVTILSGVSYISATPSSQDPQVLRARAAANYTTYTIAANTSGSTKYDWIYLAVNATNANNPDAAADNVTALTTSRSTSNTTDNGTPPTYGLLLAIVTVVNAASSITNSNITDKRVLVSFNTGTSGNANTATGWVNISTALTYSANNGNKEFVLTTANSLTSILSPGMKLAVTRGTTPSTQCMNFTAASSQYASNTSPTGITFTSAFTCEAWVKLKSYTAGYVVSRYNGTNGFALGFGSSGQLFLNASSTTYYGSNQSLPLNQWLHIAGTFNAGTFNLYINGVLVSGALTGSGTSITQAGSLQVGAANSTSFFDGDIYQPRVWSVAQTLASIQANMGIALTTATNLVFVTADGSFNDASGVGNNLTAQNSASATQADNPYNATEYGFITAVTSSSITVFAGTQCTIPNMTLNTPQYSLERSPYGFPAARFNWRVKSLYRALYTQSSPASGTWYNPASAQLSVPTGAWVTWYEGSLYVANGTNSPSGFSTLSTANNSESDTEMTVRPAYTGLTGSTAAVMGNAYRTKGYSNTSQTIYYLNVKTDASAASTVGWAPSSENTIIEAECAYI